MSERVFIYATGSEGLRSACGDLLADGMVEWVSVLDAGDISLKKDKPKINFNGRAMVMVTRADALDEVMAKLKDELGSECRAWAVPVLASI